MSNIKYANKTALWIIIINLAITVSCSFFPLVVGELTASLITSLIALYIAKQGQIKIPVARPKMKATLLCISIAITGFPIALFLNYLGTRLSGSGAAISENPYTLWQAIFVMAIFPAIAEEITFRGLLQGAFMKESVAYSVLFSSLYFAVIHSNISAALYAFFYGCLFAIIRIATENLIYTMIMHVSFNLLNVCLAYLGTDISLSSGWMIALSVFISLIFFIILGCFLYHNNISFNESKRPIKSIITTEGVVALGICFFIMITFTILR